MNFICGIAVSVRHSSRKPKDDVSQAKQLLVDEVCPLSLSGVRFILWYQETLFVTLSVLFWVAKIPIDPQQFSLWVSVTVQGSQGDDVPQATQLVMDEVCPLSLCGARGLAVVLAHVKQS